MRIPSSHLALMLAVSVAGGSSPARARQLTQLPTVASCATCVVLTHVATLGGGDSGFVRSEPIWMSRDSRGRLYVTWQNYGHGPELAAIYDSIGQFIQELGRKGQGPGEYHYPVTVNIDERDRVLVWDTDRRATLLDRDYRFIRQHTQFAATILVLPGGRQVLGQSATDRDGAAAPLSLIDSLGAVIRGFGAPQAPYIDADPWRAGRVVGPGADNSVWAARRDSYRLERWVTTGPLNRAFLRSPSWLSEPIAKQSSGAYCDRPTPVVQAIREDKLGRLWLAVSVPAPDWQRALGAQRRATPSGTRCPALVRDRLFDTMIDVIDVKSGALLSSTRVPDYVQFFLGDDLAASYREGADGTPMIDIWRMTLRPAPSR